MAQRHREVRLDPVHAVVDLNGFLPVVRRTADLLRKVAPQGSVCGHGHGLDELKSVRQNPVTGPQVGGDSVIRKPLSGNKTVHAAQVRRNRRAGRPRLGTGIMGSAVL